MTEHLCGDDPEPSERVPAGRLYVPVRPGPAGCAARLFRTPLGRRTAVGFTTRGRLAGTLGSGQAYVTLAEPALRALAEPLGVTQVVVDPRLSAPPTAAAHSFWRDWDPRMVGVIRVTGAAALIDAVALWIG
ncbi:SAV_915 family protein [Streptomyces sp. ICBB 8177]|uniref:SAV_915 family protein n=1 Tax=Streptomyces sp. ICBB 8177 TaxID=563922 RepID=UPI000D68F18C|nr:SAV_915 family protein [Streptomyces sp. ICBB 8177]